MTGLLIVGSGGQGKMVADTAHCTGRWSNIAFIDDAKPVDTLVSGWPVVGGQQDLLSLQSKFSDAIVAIGDNVKRVQLTQALLEAGFTVPTVIHPTAFVSLRVLLGAGTVVFAQAAVNIDAQCGLACIINTHAVVEHDCQLEAGVHVAPGACLAGQVHVGQGSWIGIGACVRENLSIGARAVIGAGAAVVCDILPGQTVVGVPAESQQPTPSAC